MLIHKVEHAYISRRTQTGASLIELIFVSALALLIVTGLLVSITGTAVSQTRTERLFAADMVLSARSERVVNFPYSELPTLQGTEELEQNGYTFTLETELEELSAISPNGVQQVSLTLRWEDQTGAKQRARTVLRNDS